MAIHSSSVQSFEANADVLANAMINSDFDEMGSAATPSVHVDDASDGGSTDAVVQDTDATAHAQTSFLAMPKLCFLSTATPPDRDGPPGSIVHSSPQSDDDFDTGDYDDDHQRVQSPAAVDSAESTSSSLRQLPTSNAPSPMKPRAPTAVRWVAEIVPVLEISPSEQTQQVFSRRRTQAAQQTKPHEQRAKEKTREKAKRPRKMSAVIKPNARHPYGIHFRSLQRRNADGVANHMIDSEPDEMGSPPVESSAAVDDAMDDEPTVAVFQSTDEAHAQPLLSASPEMCFLLAL
jgi:hypothetical protein